METKLTGRVIYPGDPKYDAARSDYNTRFSMYPAAIVFCNEVQDVVNAVNYAREHRLPVRARCGRHSYEAFSLVTDGIIIDVSELTQVRVHRDRGVAEVAAGMTLGPLYTQLYAAGMTIPGGSCPTVGIAGLTLGGGFGLLSRKLGLTCDNLLAVEMVTADGAVVVASEEQHPELFWACRGGGGGNFGVVTQFTFRVHEIKEVSIYNIVWDWTDLPAVLGCWQNWAPQVDERLVSILKLNAKSAGTIISIGQFMGSKAELNELLKPLLTAGQGLQSAAVQTLPFIEAVHKFAGAGPEDVWRVHHHPQHARFKNTSAYAYATFGPDAMATIVACLEQAPAATGLLQLDNYGGVIPHVAPEATAFFHRQALWNMQYQIYWSAPAEDAEMVAWVNRFRQAMLPYVQGAYVNYCDTNIDDWQRQYYGGNFGRLVQVKRQYDPGNLFTYQQSIPVAEV